LIWTYQNFQKKWINISQRGKKHFTIRGSSGDETSIFRRERQVCPSSTPCLSHSPPYSGSITRSTNCLQVSQPAGHCHEVASKYNFILFKLYTCKCQTEQAISCLLPVKWIIYHSSFCNPFFLVFFFPRNWENFMS